MSLWIKICGNTSLADAQLAADAGADAVGFVFALSPRQVSAEQVAEIVPSLPVTLEKIGVFVDADFDTIRTTVELCSLTGVQLHFAGDGDLPGLLRKHFGPALRIFRVIHFAADATPQCIAAQSDKNIDALLVDSRTATAVGGTGIAFDWQAARATVFSGESQIKLIAAGGLSPANVTQAVATLRPWGVDAVTGVESSPGRKDAAKIHAFVAAARAAADSFDIPL